MFQRRSYGESTLRPSRDGRTVYPGSNSGFEFIPLDVTPMYTVQKREEPVKHVHAKPVEYAVPFAKPETEIEPELELVGS